MIKPTVSYRYQENTLMMMHILATQYVEPNRPPHIDEKVKAEMSILDGAALSIIESLEKNEDLL